MAVLNTTQHLPIYADVKLLMFLLYFFLPLLSTPADGKTSSGTNKH